MKQPYIGNTKINKLYKGNELWCNWSSGGEGEDTPIDIIKHFDKATLTGSWMDSGLKGYNNTTTKYSKTINSTCTWSFNVPLTSNYNIYVWYPYNSNNGKTCEYSIITSNKSYTVTLSQLVNGDEWRKLVIANATEGTSISVKLKLINTSNIRINCARIESTTEEATIETNIQDLPISGGSAEMSRGGVISE